MLSDASDLGPDERRREIAAVLAAGILRLLSRPESAPSAARAEGDTVSETREDPAPRPLDFPTPSSPHVPAG